jgi:hypothetical protein
MAGFVITGLLVLLFILTIIALIIAMFIFWILMIIDVAKRDFKKDANKIAWVLIVIFLHIIGAIIYYFIVKKHNKH